MADIKDHVSSRGGSGATRYFHDNGDGTFSEAQAAHLYVKTGGVWVEWNGGSAGGGGAATIADGADVAEGSTVDVAWTGVGAGTVIAILKKMATSGTGGGPATIADGADVAEGATTDIAVTTDINGTVSGKLRGLVKILASVWDSANGRLKVDGSAVTQPVSGTFWQAAQPVTDNAGSLTVDAPVGTPVFARLSDGAAVLIGQKVMASSLPVALASDQSALPVTDNAGSLTVDAPVGTPVFARLSDGAAALIGSKVSASSLPVVIASDQGAIPVTAPTLTKGTQGANGWSVQDLKDSGRTNIALTVEFAFAQTAETLLTVTESRAGAATATFTSKLITSGKRIRFTGGFAIIETLGTGTTVPQRMYLRLRVNTAGATIATSPLQYVFGLGIATGSAAIPVKASTSAPIVIPDGVEYAGDGTATYGLTLETPDWVVTTGTGRAKITLFAFEY